MPKHYNQISILKIKDKKNKIKTVLCGTREIQHITSCRGTVVKKTDLSSETMEDKRKWNNTLKC